MDGLRPQQAPNRWSAAATVAWLLGHRQAAAVVLLAGAASMWCGSQWPQAVAPLATTDGLDRQDLLTLHTLGLDRWALSLPVAMWSVAAVAVALLRLWFVGDTTASPPASGLRRAALHVAWAAALAVWTAWLWSAAAETPAVVVDVAVASKPQPAQAWTADAGRLAPAVGTWLGACQQQRTQLACQIDGPQGPWRFAVTAGAASTEGPWQWTWLARTVDPAADHFSLDLPASAGNRTPRRIALQSGRAIDTPETQTRWLPAVPAAAGPFVAAVVPGRLSVWTSPALATHPRAAARIQGGEVVRLSLSPRRTAQWLWPLVWPLLAVAAWLTWGPQQRRPAKELA